MFKREKQQHRWIFMISLIICFLLFISPAYAADLKEMNDTVEDGVMTDQEMPTEVTDEEAVTSEEISEKDASSPAEQLTEKEDPTEKEDLLEKEEASAAEATVENDTFTLLTESSEGSDSVALENTEEELDAETPEIEEANEDPVPEPVKPFARPLKDGTYIIVSKMNGFLALQPEGSSKDAGKQVEVRDCNGSNAQKFKLTGDALTGYYSITNVNSGQNLAVKGDVAKTGTSIVQKAASSSLGQKWILVEKNGYYTIQSALDGTPLALALKNTSMANGTDAVLQEVKDTATQLFSFLVSKPSVTINEGVYEICSALNNSMVLDISGGSLADQGNLQIYKSSDVPAQRFLIEKAGSGQYTIKSYNSGKVLDLSSGSKAAMTNVQQYTKNGTAAQNWLIRNVGDGTLYITSGKSWFPLEVQNGKAVNKANIFVNKASGSNAQKFTFKKVADDKVKPIANGTYLLRSAKNTNRVIGVEDASRLQKANIQLQYNSNASFQKFKITYVKNGYYKIQNVKSKHMIDISDGSCANKANIQQYHDNGTQAQLWLPHRNSDGSYAFINAKSGKVLDVANGSTADSANIWAYGFNNSAAQRFKLEKTSGSDSTAINYGTKKADSVLSAMCKKAQDYYSDTNYLILCNVTNHRLVLFKEMEGRWISVMNSPISVGKASTPTPTGTFYVYNHWRYFDGDYNDSELTYQCWWSTCFYGSYYFHSVLYDYNSGYPGRLRDGRMEVNVSHGCVRMPLDNAEYLYDHSPIGTKVRVYK